MPEELERKQDDDGDTMEGVGVNRARDILGELVNRAGYGGERIPLTRNGKQVAALVSMKDVERLRALDAPSVGDVAA
jgi:prevent-host-death family protein